MNPKRTLLVVMGLVVAWAWWSVVLDGRRGDADEATRAEAAVQSARADAFVPTMTEEEALAIAAEAEAPLVFFGDPGHPDRAESRSRHVRSAMFALIDEHAPNACAPSISDAGAVPGPHTSEIITLTVAVTVADTGALRSFLGALVDHPLVRLQSISVEESVDGGGGDSQTAMCEGLLVRAAFDLWGRSAPIPSPAPERGTDG